MQAVKQMTSKDLHLAVKRNDGIEYLIRRFGFESEVALETAIHRVSPSNGDDFIKKLRKKQSKFAAVVEETPRGVQNAVEEEETSTDSEERTVIEAEVTDAVGTDRDVSEEKDVKQAMTLEVLKQEESRLSAMVRRLEGEHKELVAQRRDYVSRLLDERAVLERLTKECEAQRTIVMELSSAYQKCAEKMRVINLDLWLNEGLLNETREEIAALTKVVIFVYEDGSIGVENAELPCVEEDKLREEANSLISLPQAEDFTIKTVKNLARLHLMVKEYGEKAELVFDSSRLQTFWETVITA